jgi:hypothetical protein
MRTRLTPDETNGLLDNYYPAFNDMWKQSHTQSMNAMNMDRQIGISHFTSRHKAGLMWHYAMNISVKLFEDDPEMKPCIFNKVYGLLFNDALFIRLKKLNGDMLRASNVPTIQATQFANQGNIPNFPSKPCILNLGYRIEKQWSGIRSVHITCPKNLRENIWSIDLMNVMGSNTKEIEFEPFDERLSPSIEHLLKIKEQKKQKKGDIVNG